MSAISFLCRGSAQDQGFAYSWLQNCLTQNGERLRAPTTPTAQTVRQSSAGQNPLKKKWFILPLEAHLEEGLEAGA